LRQIWRWGRSEDVLFFLSQTFFVQSLSYGFKIYGVDGLTTAKRKPLPALFPRLHSKHERGKKGLPINKERSPLLRLLFLVSSAMPEGGTLPYVARPPYSHTLQRQAKRKKAGKKAVEVDSRR
jgi:hypothetical protein